MMTLTKSNKVKRWFKIIRKKYIFNPVFEIPWAPYRYNRNLDKIEEFPWNFKNESVAIDLSINHLRRPQPLHRIFKIAKKSKLQMFLEDVYKKFPNITKSHIYAALLLSNNNVEHAISILELQIKLEYEQEVENNVKKQDEISEPLNLSVCYSTSTVEKDLPQKIKILSNTVIPPSKNPSSVPSLIKTPTSIKNTKESVLVNVPSINSVNTTKPDLPTQFLPQSSSTSNKNKENTLPGVSVPTGLNKIETDQILQGKSTSNTKAHNNVVLANTSKSEIHSAINKLRNYRKENKSLLIQNESSSNKNGCNNSSSAEMPIQIEIEDPQIPVNNNRVQPKQNNKPVLTYDNVLSCIQPDILWRLQNQGINMRPYILRAMVESPYPYSCENNLNNNEDETQVMQIDENIKGDVKNNSIHLLQLTEASNTEEVLEIQNNVATPECTDTSNNTTLSNDMIYKNMKTLDDPTNNVTVSKNPTKNKIISHFEVMQYFAAVQKASEYHNNFAVTNNYTGVYGQKPPLLENASKQNSSALMKSYSPNVPTNSDVKVTKKPKRAYKKRQTKKHVDDMSQNLPYMSRTASYKPRYPHPQLMSKNLDISKTSASLDPKYLSLLANIRRQAHGWPHITDSANQPLSDNLPGTNPTSKNFTNNSAVSSSGVSSAVPAEVYGNFSIHRVLPHIVPNPNSAYFRHFNIENKNEPLPDASKLLKNNQAPNIIEHSGGAKNNMPELPTYEKAVNSLKLFQNGYMPNQITQYNRNCLLANKLPSNAPSPPPYPYRPSIRSRGDTNQDRLTPDDNLKNVTDFTISDSGSETNPSTVIIDNKQSSRLLPSTNIEEIKPSPINHTVLDFKQNVAESHIPREISSDLHEQSTTLKLNNKLTNPKPYISKTADSSLPILSQHGHSSNYNLTDQDSKYFQASVKDNQQTHISSIHAQELPSVNTSNEVKNELSPSLSNKKTACESSYIVSIDSLSNELLHKRPYIPKNVKTSLTDQKEDRCSINQNFSEPEVSDNDTVKPNFIDQSVTSSKLQDDQLDSNNSNMNNTLATGSITEATTLSDDNDDFKKSKAPPFDDSEVKTNVNSTRLNEDRCSFNQNFSETEVSDNDTVKPNLIDRSVTSSKLQDDQVDANNSNMNNTLSTGSITEATTLSGDNDDFKKSKAHPFDDSEVKTNVDSTRLNGDRCSFNQNFSETEVSDNDTVKPNLIDQSVTSSKLQDDQIDANNSNMNNTLSTGSITEATTLSGDNDDFKKSKAHPFDDSGVKTNVDSTRLNEDRCSFTQNFSETEVSDNDTVKHNLIDQSITSSKLQDDQLDSNNSNMNNTLSTGSIAEATTLSGDNDDFKKSKAYPFDDSEVKTNVDSTRLNEDRCSFNQNFSETEVSDNDTVKPNLIDQSVTSSKLQDDQLDSNNSNMNNTLSTGSITEATTLSGDNDNFKKSKAHPFDYSEVKTNIDSTRLNEDRCSFNQNFSETEVSDNDTVKPNLIDQSITSSKLQDDQLDANNNNMNDTLATGSITEAMTLSSDKDDFKKSKAHPFDDTEVKTNVDSTRFLPRTNIKEELLLNINTVSDLKQNTVSSNRAGSGRLPYGVSNHTPKQSSTRQTNSSVQNLPQNGCNSYKNLSKINGNEDHTVVCNSLDQSSVSLSDIQEAGQKDSPDSQLKGYPCTVIQQGNHESPNNNEVNRSVRSPSEVIQRFLEHLWKLFGFLILSDIQKLIDMKQNGYADATEQIKRFALQESKNKQEIRNIFEKEIIVPNVYPNSAKSIQVSNPTNDINVASTSNQNILSDPDIPGSFGNEPSGLQNLKNDSVKPKQIQSRIYGLVSQINASELLYNPLTLPMVSMTSKMGHPQNI